LAFFGDKYPEHNRVVTIPIREHPRLLGLAAERTSNGLATSG
jgi:hypothetical protein